MSSSSSNTVKKSIGPNDIISVHGQYLYKPDGSRFFMKGIAFPVPLEQLYNSTSWIDILTQLDALKLEYNTVRIYSMDPTIDYSDFFHAAAKLGVYVIVPLTGRSGDGVLDRNKAAPKCYTRQLYEYGISAINNYLRYSNVLAGLIANEVMNAEDTWSAAPCIKAYARDIKLYMKGRNMRPLPMLYAAQHSGIGSEGEVGMMWLTLNYLTCSGGSGDVSKRRIASAASAPSAPDDASIDMFGVNIESWCSSKQSFVYEEDGKSAGSYYSLWLGLHQSTVPLIFTEMGCSHTLFNRDNGLHTSGGTRDWKQLHVVLHEMSDTFSGFCAYAYSGNPQFDMFKGGPWRNEVLEPTDDFYAFRDELLLESGESAVGIRDPPIDYERFFTPKCRQAEEELQDCCGIELYPVEDIPSYASQPHTSSSQGGELEMSLWHHCIGAMMTLGYHHIGHMHMPSLVLIVAVCGILFMWKWIRRGGNSGYEQIN
ncbi:hypothetical protein ACHAWT_000218 [Skeletonema menzelii]